MPTPVLHVPRLAEMMRDYSACAFDENLRYHGDTDAVLLGKLTMLDVIAENLWTGDYMTAAEEAAMHTAQAELNRAWEHLRDRHEAANATAPEVKHARRARALGLRLTR